MKKIILAIFITLLFNVNVFSAPYININITYDGSTHKYNAEEVYLYVNSKKVENLTMPPIILNGYTLVPVREVFEQVGASVTWLKDSEEIHISYKDKSLKLKINQNSAYLNNSIFNMSIPPKLINNKTMVPVRFISENLGLGLNWDNSTRIIKIDEISKPTSVPEKEPEKPLENIDTSKVITYISMPDSDERTFGIQANEKIQKFEVNKLEDGSFALDIYNFKSSLKENEFTSVSEFVSKVLIDETNEEFLRIKFEMIKDTFFYTFKSSDGKIIYINFGGNVINKIETYNDGKDDILKIYSENIPDMQIEDLLKEKKLLLKIQNSVISSLTESFKETKYIESVKYNSGQENQIIIEVNLKEEVSFYDEIEDGQKILKFGINLKKPEVSEELQNYENGKNSFIIPKKTSLNVDLNAISHVDDYLNKKYILNFDSDISSLIKSGSYPFKDTTLVKSALVESIDSKTRISFSTKKLIAVNITEDSENIYIGFVTPKEKYENIIVFDPGHGGTDPGTSGYGFIEKNLTVDLVNRVLKLFEDANDQKFKVYSSRVTDVYPSFNDRTNMGNEVGDIFVSIHFNAASKNTKPSGTEVYHLNLNTDKRGINSKEMAKIFQDNLVDSLQTIDRGVKTANFKVLRDSKIPAVLCEIAFLSNPDEAKRVGTNEFMEKAANAIYESCIQIFEKYPKK